MEAILPPRLKAGDEIRVVGPSRSVAFVSAETRTLAVRTLTQLGFTVSFGKRSLEQDEFGFAPITARLADLHAAFANDEVKALLPAMGGYNCNQLLKYLDYDLIREHPKILCGFSDITALANSIHARSGLVTYNGPNFSSFAMQKGNAYTIETFLACLTHSQPLDVPAAKEWSDDAWHEDQNNRTFHANGGPFVVRPGEAEGVALGGNLCTFNLLHGTEFMPPLDDAILFLEDDNQVNPCIFDRDLQSLIQQPGFRGVKALIIGRFQPGSGISREILFRIIDTKIELRDLLVVAGVDFGHTTPVLTFPVGGRVRVRTNGDKVELWLLRH